MHEEWIFITMSEKVVTSCEVMRELAASGVRKKKKVLVRARGGQGVAQAIGHWVDENTYEYSLLRRAKLPVSSQGCVQCCIYCFHCSYDRPKFRAIGPRLIYVLKSPLVL